MAINGRKNISSHAVEKYLDQSKLFFFSFEFLPSAVELKVWNCWIYKFSARFPTRMIL